MKLHKMLFLVGIVAGMFMVFQMAYAAEPTLTFGGNARTDLTIESKSNGSDELAMSPGGRLLLSVTGRMEGENGWYAEGYGEGLFDVDEAASGGDMYVEVGNSKFSFRYGNAGLDDIFDWGEDFYVAKAGGPDRYDGDEAYVGGSNMAIFNMKASDQLKVQVTGLLSKGTESDVDVNEYGIRPAVTFTSDKFTVGGGVDYYLATPQNGDANGEITKLGFAGYADVTLGNLVVGAAGAMGTTGGKSFEDDSDLTEESVLHTRAFVTFVFAEKHTLGISGGYAKNDETEDDTVFGYVAYTMKPFMVKGLRLQVGASYATASVSDEDQTTTGGKIRLRYDL